MKRNKESSVRASKIDTPSNSTPEGFVSPRSHFLAQKAKRVEGEEPKNIQRGEDIKENRQLEELTPEEFASKMENDPVFRKEMLRRQAAAVDRIEAERREMRERWKKKSPSLDAKFLSPFLSDETVFYGGGCSAYFIKTASVQELKKAVREKRLSDTRFRMEMKRRRNRAYYDNIPDRTYEYLNTP